MSGIAAGPPGPQDRRDIPAVNEIRLGWNNQLNVSISN